MKVSNYHYSVMLNEVIKNLDPKENAIYVDCTLGMGGYAKKILSIIPKTSLLICFDKDPFAIDNFQSYITKNLISNVKLINDDFKNLKKYLDDMNIKNIDWIVYDLGVSSPQIDNSIRGFSYKNDGPLDMRMNTNQKTSAFDIVNFYTLEKLFKIFKEYAESKFSMNVAKAIIDYRKNKSINTTLELVDIIKSALPTKELVKNKHPAKVFFQAIRIEVNQELSFLEESINQSASMLSKDGILQVVTFHSLEDKIIKDSFKKLTSSKIPSYLPIKDDDILFKVEKSIKPSKKELEENSRSKSAKLRILVRKGKNEN